MTVISTNHFTPRQIELQQRIDLAADQQRQDQHLTATLMLDAVIDDAPELFHALNDHRFASAWKAFKQAQDLSQWRHYDRLQRLIQLGITQQDPWFVGEATLATPALSNLDLLHLTRQHANLVLNEFNPAHATSRFNHQPPVANKKIKLGFVGCDFFGQATAYLLTGAIEALDRTKFEVHAYDHGDTIPEQDLWRDRATNAYDHVTRITDMSDDDAAQKIFDDGIDVLLCIKNPINARLGVFAQRPAPIQIHYLYFPGTSGMPFFDYFIGDDVVTPPEFDNAFAEKILRIEGCYQPNDGNRLLPQESTRADWDLPVDAIVLANMSQNYKITPDIFEQWMRLLHADPRRVLWLLSNDEVVRNNLRHEATIRGIAPERLFFSKPQPTQAHLTRLRCADIIVDTFPYGGHTLTSDALWAGAPMVTLAGTTYASRVAASLLHSVGLGELVAWHVDEYFQKIDALARDPQRLAAYRKYLDEHRYSFDLFSPKSYAERFGRLMVDTVEKHWAR